jgi:DNA-binding response OmpR family regulator
MGKKLNERQLPKIPLMNNYHILLVDDDYMTLSVLKEYLSCQGYHVTTAENCLHAKEVLRNPKKIDLIILDYLMPDGNGTDLLRSIAAEKDLQRPPVIMFSSILDSQNANWEALRKRLPPISQSIVQGYVTKPYTFENMDAAVRHVLKITKTNTNPPQFLSGDYLSPAPNPSQTINKAEKQSKTTDR